MTNTLPLPHNPVLALLSRAVRFLNQFRLDPRQAAGGWIATRRVPGSYPVTPETALTYSAVFACMRVIAETLAMLEWEVFERLPSGASRQRSDVRTWYLLNRRPNDDMPAMNFREAIVMQMLGWGNAYAEIVWGNDGYPYQLWPIPSSQVDVERDSRGNLVYFVHGNLGEEDRTIRAENMLHWRNIGTNGVFGLSTVSQAAQTISFGKELEQFGAIGFQNAPFLSGWMEFPGKMPDKEHADALKRSWRNLYMGWRNAGEVPLLENGLSYHQLQLPLRDAQFLESRQFQAQEVCRWFRVPQHKIGILEEASYANIESLEIDCFNETFLPATIRLQQEVDYKLFEGSVRSSKFFTRHSLAPILKGDLKTRYEAYSIGLRYGFLSINDVRQMEDLDNVSNGELRTVQLNTVPLDEFEALAHVKLEQAEADLAYREAQTEALVARGEQTPDATREGTGGGGTDLFTPEQAAAPATDDVKAGTQALRRLQLVQMERRRLQPSPLRVESPFPDRGEGRDGNHSIPRPGAAGAR
jgi:HK97 family phage portal protein